MIKLKDLLKESFVWERKFGEPLITLEDAIKKHASDKLSEKVSKKDYQELAKDFVGEHKRRIIQRASEDGGVDIQMMAIDTAEAMKYDPDYKGIDADWLYGAIGKELKKHSWWKKLDIGL
jgi:hypothetical protein